MNIETRDIEETVTRVSKPARYVKRDGVDVFIEAKYFDQVNKKRVFVVVDGEDEHEFNTMFEAQNFISGSR